ncbi:hypothetical protein [Chryseobacterium sp. ERMR1:04]|uniref:hypothetical protein n=1 Tax=Chryseobacterium sp. ERMR1:04 TaxID=1705393 RepID=UPI0006C87DF4|nr:hypothetical protein [Chryseobacterium sp. ERMR1:04]KPH11848.1 hypothetical protein AMQ68_21040 [Chryseobacterium sp. ERMR1:04]
MKKLNFKISPSTIRKANKNLIFNGIDASVKEAYTGIITARSRLNGVVKVREISKDKISEAYGKSLKSYAEKL